MASNFTEEEKEELMSLFLRLNSFRRAYKTLFESYDFREIKRNPEYSSLETDFTSFSNKLIRATFFYAGKDFSLEILYENKNFYTKVGYINVDNKLVFYAYNAYSTYFVDDFEVTKHAIESCISIFKREINYLSNSREINSKKDEIKKEFLERDFSIEGRKYDN